MVELGIISEKNYVVILPIFMIIIFLIAIFNHDGKGSLPAKKGNTEISHLSIIEVDGHEYILYSPFNSGGGLCHKENCKFCSLGEDND